MSPVPFARAIWKFSLACASPSCGRERCRGAIVSETCAVRSCHVVTKKMYPIPSLKPPYQVTEQTWHSNGPAPPIGLPLRTRDCSTVFRFSFVFVILLESVGLIAFCCAQNVSLPSVFGTSTNLTVFVAPCNDPSFSCSAFSVDRSVTLSNQIKSNIFEIKFQIY